MTKTFCDRCGKEISTNHRSGLYAWIMHKVYFSKIRIITSSADVAFDYDNDDQYLCTDCEESYIHWFMNPEEDK